MLTIGDKFPDFSLDGVKGEKESHYDLNSIKGKWNFIFFYPEDFSFICPTEAKAFEEHREELAEQGAQVFGISVDDINTHKAWIKELGLSFPLLSDHKFTLSTNLGVLDTDNRAKRATFIVDPSGIIQFIMVTSRNVGRSVKETLRIFNAIQTGRMCPVEYTGN